MEKETMTEISKGRTCGLDTLQKCDKCKLYFSTDFEGSTDKSELCDKCWGEGLE